MIAEIITWFQLQFQTNEIFAGLFAVSALGTVLYALRAVPSLLWGVFLSQYTVQLQVLNTDEAFDWLIEWLGRQDYAKRTRRLKVSSGQSTSRLNEEKVPEFILSPGNGNHFFRHKNKLVWLERTESENKTSGKPKETIKFRVVGRSQELVREIILEAKKLVEEDEYIKVYNWAGSYWSNSAFRLPRHKESLVLKEGQCERVLKDIEDFLENSNWYSMRGVPWRRGYLFTGKPGTGKSSFALIAASYFKRPIYSLSLNAVTDVSLVEALGDAPREAILLIEDVDAAQASVDRKKGDKKEDLLTTSGLLNAFDGVAATEGRILFMTTNYPEKLDSALIRPGRVDLQEEFEECDRDMIIRMFLIFYPGEEGCAQHFADKVELSKPSPAKVQGIFINHRTLDEIVNYDPTT